MPQCLAICIFLISTLSASVVEYSPSANALNGITLLSDSVADLSLSPVLRTTGISTFYHRPFNSPEIAVMGFATAVARQHFGFAAGSSYLYHRDYAWHQPFINASFHYQGFTIGSSGHMDYDSVQSADARYRFCYDLGAGYSYSNLAAELKCLRIGSADAQIGFSLKAVHEGGVQLAANYSYEEDESGMLRIGMRTEIHEHLCVYGSWQNDPNRFGLGLRLEVQPWSLIYSIRSHPDLDLSHGIAVDIAW